MRLVKDDKSQDCKRVDISEGKGIKAEIKNTAESKIRQEKTFEEQKNMRLLRKAIIYLVLEKSRGLRCFFKVMKEAEPGTKSKSSDSKFRTNVASFSNVVAD